MNMFARHTRNFQDHETSFFSHTLWSFSCKSLVSVGLCGVSLVSQSLGSLTAACLYSYKVLNFNFINPKADNAFVELGCVD